jgi:hypothetical protein
MAGPLAAGDLVGNKFIIVDEEFDFERPSAGTVAWREWDFGIRHGVTTQAVAVFAQSDGKDLSQYDANSGSIRCMNTDYLTVADASSGIVARGKPVVLDLTPVLFEVINTATDPQDWRLRADWQTRLTNFKNHAGNNYNSTTLLFISLHAEVTGTDLTSNELQTAATKVKQLFPGVKVAAGYPTTGGRENRLPAQFPAALDIVVTWDYNIGDPSKLPYFNVNNPSDLTTDYGKILAALQPQVNQDIYYLVAGFNDGNVLGSASEFHQPTGLYFGTLLRNWCAFALKKFPNRNGGLLVWAYNDGYGCTTGACGAGCSGLTRFTTGANRTFAYESSLTPPSDSLIRAYQAVSRAAQFGDSCWAP